MHNTEHKSENKGQSHIGFCVYYDLRVLTFAFLLLCSVIRLLTGVFYLLKDAINDMKENKEATE